MKKIERVFLGASLCSLISFGVISCTNEEQITETSTNENYSARIYDENLFESMFVTQKEQVFKKFSFAFAEALETSPMLRNIIREEALKEFNQDTEVLLAMIKDREVENGRVEDLINSKLVFDKLEDILNAQPDLTILIPELPEETFNAERWQTETQIPVVAIRLESYNDVPIIGRNMETGVMDSDVLSYEDVPGFPVLVVKSNERVVSNLQNRFDDIEAEPFYTSSSGISYKFLDDAFDGIKIKGPVFSLIENRKSEAYEYYKNKDGWQRDYVYYRIHHGNPNGPLSHDYKEFITNFTTDNPLALYKKIADQTGDAKFNSQLCNSCQGGFNSWTGGQYEFKFIVINNSTSGGGISFEKYQSVNPRELFNVHYTHTVRKFLGWKRNYFNFQSITANVTDFNLELFNWDLKTKSYEIKIIVSEEDSTEEQKRTETFNTKFATNFGADMKLGLKFGGSMEANQIITYEYKTTKTSDPLGDATIEFGEKFYINKTGNGFERRYYPLGNYAKFVVEPKKVQ